MSLLYSAVDRDGPNTDASAPGLSRSNSPNGSDGVGSLFSRYVPSCGPAFSPLSLIQHAGTPMKAAKAMTMNLSIPFNDEKDIISIKADAKIAIVSPAISRSGTNLAADTAPGHHPRYFLKISVDSLF